jgi:hypothetical protein
VVRFNLHGNNVHQAKVFKLNLVDLCSHLTGRFLLFCVAPFGLHNSSVSVCQVLRENHWWIVIHCRPCQLSPSQLLRKHLSLHIRMYVTILPQTTYRSTSQLPSLHKPHTPFAPTLKPVNAVDESLVVNGSTQQEWLVARILFTLCTDRKVGKFPMTEVLLDVCVFQYVLRVGEGPEA